VSNIAISNTYQRFQYTATAGQTIFAIPFVFFDDADLVVYQNSTLLTLTTNYTVTGANNPGGGTLTLVVGATLNDLLTIIGALDVDRTSIYRASKSLFSASDLNSDFNRETVMIKQQQTYQDLLMLQYQPYAEISQDITVVKDRWLPLLTANQIWRKKSDDTEIEAVDLPSIVAGLAGNIVNDNRLMKTDTSASNTLQETGITVSDADAVSGISDLALTTSLTVAGVTYPTAASGVTGQVVGLVGPTTLGFTNTGDGDVDGPAAATDNAYARFDTTTGKLIQNSQTTEDDAGNVIFPATVTLNADPTTALEAATKQYVDASVAASEWKDSVVCASIIAYTATYDNGVLGVGATLTNNDVMAAFAADGINPVVGDRILIKDQAAPAQNGIYSVTVVGDGATNWVLTRVVDMDTADEMNPGVFVAIDQGTTLGTTSWFETSNVTTVGTDAVSFNQFSYGSYALIQDGSKSYAASSAGSDSYAITLSPAPNALTAGMVVNFKADVANTGAATLNVNTLGADAIIKSGGNPLQTNDILADQLSSVIYDGTSWQLISPANNVANSIVGENLLINGDMQFIQRAASSVAVTAASTAYTMDRWQLYTADNAATVTQQSGPLTGQKYVTISRDAAETGTGIIRFCQSIPIGWARNAAGNTVTLSIDVSKGATFSAASDEITLTVYTGESTGAPGESGIGGAFTNSATVINTTQAITTTSTTYTFNSTTIGASVTQLAVEISWSPTGTAGATDNISIRNIKLEYGDQFTGFNYLSPVRGLELCNAFYHKTYDQGVAPGAVASAGGKYFAWISTITQKYNFVEFRVPMIAIPTITTYSPVSGTSGKVRITGSTDVNSALNNQSTTSISIGSNDVTITSIIYYHYTAEAELV
jgi:hypothetical protein